MNFNQDNHQQTQIATIVKLEKAIKDNQSNCPSPKNTIVAPSKKISTSCRTTPVKIENCKYVKPDFCTRVNNECQYFDQALCGNLCTPKKEKPRTICQCIKFNGLQDSCEHPGCSIKDDCLDIPFPNCPPARKWRYDYWCPSKKNTCDQL